MDYFKSNYSVELVCIEKISGVFKGVIYEIVSNEMIMDSAECYKLLLSCHIYIPGIYIYIKL